MTKSSASTGFPSEIDLTDPENPEWTQEDLNRARGPESLSDVERRAFPLTKIRGPQRAPTKTPLSLRVDADVVERYRATGPGWQGRMNAALRAGLSSL